MTTSANITLYQKKGTLRASGLPYVSCSLSYLWVCFYSWEREEKKFSRKHQQEWEDLRSLARDVFRVCAEQTTGSRAGFQSVLAQREAVRTSLWFRACTILNRDASWWSLVRVPPGWESNTEARVQRRRSAPPACDYMALFVQRN